jgi:hypothetical protein
MPSWGLGMSMAGVASEFSITTGRAPEKPYQFQNSFANRLLSSLMNNYPDRT